MKGLAYIACGIPAIIGVAFVARYAYVTSDTAVDGIAATFLLGMVAVGAFVGPAVVVAVSGNGRRGAAVALGVLTGLAIAANWSHTLGAIAHRTAGSDAETAKASATAADARAELNRIMGERKAMPAFTPATAETIAAAKRAADTASKNREAECAKRGQHCRQREQDEQGAADKLTTATTNKAATDQAAKLDADAAEIRAQLAKAPAIKEANALGNALVRLLPWLPATSAATYQQAIVSLIAELLIAAGLALPELLRRTPKTPPIAAGALLAPVLNQGVAEALEPGEASQQGVAAVSEAVQPPSARTIRAPASEPERAGNLGRFMLACLPRIKGEEVPLSAVYARYQRWCAENQPACTPLPAGEFATEFRVLARRVGLPTEKRGGAVVVRDVRIAA